MAEHYVQRFVTFRTVSLGFERESSRRALSLSNFAARSQVVLL